MSKAWRSKISTDVINQYEKQRRNHEKRRAEVMLIQERNQAARELETPVDEWMSRNG
jgi:hypothetical protein